MAKIATIALPALFSTVSATRTEHVENNDCAVIALAITTGVTYSEAYAALKAAGREDGKGTSRPITFAALEALGFTATLFNMRPVIADYPGIHKTLKNATSHHARRFKAVWDEHFAGRTALLFTKSHVAAYKDNRVEDWTVNFAKRIEAVYIIEKAVAVAPEAPVEVPAIIVPKKAASKK